MSKKQTVNSTSHRTKIGQQIAICQEMLDGFTECFRQQRDIPDRFLNRYTVDAEGTFRPRVKVHKTVKSFNRAMSEARRKANG